MNKLFGLFGPLCCVFEKDDGAAGGDANDANASGGSDDSSKGGGGGDKGDDSGSKKEESYTIKVDGQDRQVNLEELKTMAAKSGGADARFQEASDIKKSSEKGARIGDLIDSLSGDGDPSEAAVRELSGLIGVNPEEFLKYLGDGDTSTQKTDSSAKMSKDALSEALTELLGRSPAEVQATLEHSNQRHVKSARVELREFSDQVVDKDEIIGKMIVGEGKEDVLTAVKDMVAEDVLRKIQDGEPYGAELVASSVQSVRAKLTKLGIPNKPGQQPIVLGLGPGQGLPLDVQADEPIKRISAADDANEENLVARYLQSAIKFARQQK
jgi:hypothetical protein